MDDFSLYTWIILLHNKSEVRNHILKFIAYAENQFQTTVQIIRTDNGIEFAMKDFFSSKGIIHQTTCVETPEQNDIVERKHQHLLNVTRALLFQANLPPFFWDFAVQHVALLINCIPTPFLRNTSPYEKLNGKLFDLSCLHVFGCLCYSNTLTAHRKKLDAHSVHGIFLGFQPNTKGYLFLNLTNHNIEVSRHIVFHEDHFPYKMNTAHQKNHNDLSLPLPPNYDSNCDFSFDLAPLETPTHHPLEAVLDAPPPLEVGMDAHPRRSTRPRRPPTYLEDFQTELPLTNNVSTK